MDRWRGRVVLVTGACSEIGRSIVAELSKYPLKIVALDQKISLIQEFANELQSTVAEIYPLKCDFSESDILKAFEWIKTTIGQGVSVLINNAETFTKSRILDGETYEWRNMLNLNVLAATICCRESYISMKANSIDDGHVININSTAGHTMLPFPGQKIYNSTKIALNYLTEGFRHELAHAGTKIKVTSISPGRVMIEGLVGSIEHNSSTSIVLPMKPERVALMTIIALSTPSDIVIAELTVLSVGETIQAYPPSMIS